MIRYYGLYARHRESDKHLIKAINKEKHKLILDFNKWRHSIYSSFGYDLSNVLVATTLWSFLKYTTITKKLICKSYTKGPF